MNEFGTSNFEYLNHGGKWPRFERAGLETSERGALRLSSLPVLRETADESPVTLPAPDGPAGLAVAADGSVYWSDLNSGQVWVLDGCDATTRPLPCLITPDDNAYTMRSPRALLVHPTRQVLLIADTGNDRIQVIELGTWQRVAIWGGAGTAPGKLNRPWSLAADADGNVFVADYGNRRVQKFDPGGQVIADFWDNVRTTAPGLSRPAEVAYDVVTQRLYVRDEEHRVYVFDDAGNKQYYFDISAVDHALGLAVTEASVYVGDNTRRRIIRFKADGVRVGGALGYEGPVAALATDDKEGLWVLPYRNAQPIRLDRSGGYVSDGVLWGGPIGSSEVSRIWQRLSALGDPTPDGARFRFYLHTADADSVAPPAPQLTLGSTAFDCSVWREMPPNVADVLVEAETHFVWIGAHFGGDGDATPVLEQLRIAFDHDGYIQHLPAVYQKKGDGSAFLKQLLALFESSFNDVESEIETLVRYFDPVTVPAAWLDWLAGWLGLSLEEDWSEEKRRRAVSDAFESYAWRGTARGLRSAIRSHTGIEVRIEEPLLHASWWSLPDEPDTADDNITTQSTLGFTTRLGGAQPQGAVVGTTAVLDQSQFITQEEFGAPLFEELAHQFSIYVHRSQVSDPRRLEELHAVVQRQKPAHTVYQVCVIEPTVLVGYQATLGVDMVVGGGPSSPSRLGQTDASKSGVVLAGTPAGRLGHSRTGQSTRLGEGNAVSGD